VVFAGLDGVLCVSRCGVFYLITCCGYYFALAVVLCWVFVRVCLGAERWCGFVWVGSLRG